MTSIESLLQEAQQKLVGAGTRSRLVHVNRKAKRSDLLNIINERSDDVYQIMRVKGRQMKFAGKGEEEDEAEADGIVLGEITDEEFDESRYTDLILETPLTPDALQKRLLRLSKDSRTAEEEQGINILFLALGFLQWYEDKKSEVLRESPLILLPVTLVRNARTSTFDLVCRDDDIVANMSLQERMQRDFGVSLPEIDDAKDWLPSEYFAEVAKVIGRKDRWALDPDGMQLGFFSFAKLVMFHDLDPEKWAGKAPLVNKLISGLLGGGFESTPPLFKDDDNLDAVLPPQQILQVVDADASQTKVIEEVRAGSNLVVQGPPGTGKSQTITNILAAAVHDGKKVLFVAEKMAALEVVYNRMCKVGLQDLCLELHSRRANRRAFLQALAETIFRSKGARLSEANTSELRQSRDELNRIDNLLHSPLPERDYTPFQVLSALCISRHGPVARVGASQLKELEASVHSAAENRLFGRLDDYVQIVQKHGPGEKNPFAGATNLELQPTDLQTLAEDLQAATARLDEWVKAQRALEEQLKPEPALTLASAQSSQAIYRKLQNPPGEFAQFIGLACRHRESPRFGDAIASGSAWTGHKEQMSGLVTDSVWNYDLDSLRPPMARGAGSWWARVFGKYGSASKEFGTYLRQELPKLPAGRLQLLDQVIEGKSKKKLFDEEAEYLKSALGENWRGERTPFAGMLEVVNWLGGLPQELRELSAEQLKGLVAHEVTVKFDPRAFDAQREALLSAIKRVEECLGLDALAAERIQTLPLQDIRHRMDEMSRNTDKYDVWTQYQFARAALLEFPVGEFLELVDQGRVALDDAGAELKYVLNKARWEYAVARPELKDLRQWDRHALATSFATLEKDRVQDTQQLIRQKHLSQVPQGAVGEMGLIRGEIAKQRNYRPIRQMMRRAGGMIQRIKPVFLMSPISVAQFLPPGEVEFDLLVIDEASQVRPEDALGSVARARQIVVVGDQKQLPPTSFFERLTANTEPAEEEDDEEMIGIRATEMESVLSLCEARGLNERMLEWHYRSKDPSLITVSNVEFYQNRLILPPCPTESDEASGLRLVRVPGVYAPRAPRASGTGKGRPGTNRIEAEAVAGRLQEIARSRPDCSVGVVTFSEAQARMMTEVFELRRRQDGTLNRFLAENKFENVFVKNIENVQGDERDIILISVGYGPRKPNGQLASMSFGPVNSEGGERRLNVLFTRSRIACEVFASFDPGDINLTRTAKKGPAVLRKFLKYAQNRELPEVYLSQGEADSPFEEDVADEIRRMGYEADHQVGTAGFRIDLGVRDRANPQRHILAVECDGATYHAALWARERDRLRQEILEGFGWHFHRIWSTDWFYRRASEVQKLRQALEEAQVRAQSSPLKGANSLSASRADEGEDEAQSSEKAKPIVLEEAKIELPKYRKADIVADAGRAAYERPLYEPHERPLPGVADIVCEIAEVEGPVHRDEIARRYASAHGKMRAGERMRSHVNKGLAQAQKEARLVSKGEFWGTKQQFTEVPVRDRSEESGPTASAESISPAEIRACAQLIKQDSGTVEEDELIRAIAKTLGFKRAGPEFQSIVKAALQAE